MRIKIRNQNNPDVFYKNKSDNKLLAIENNMNEIELKINMIAQEMIIFSDGISWFSSMSEVGQKEVLDKLCACCYQVHPRPDEIDQALILSKLKKTYTPCILIKKENFSHSLAKIINLPSNEHLKSFQLLLSVFIVADKRRRLVDCKGGCSHEWHNIK